MALPSKHTSKETALIPPLYKHQEEGIKLLREYENFAILAQMGTGKTRMIVEDWLTSNNECLLVVAPKSVYRNWQNELDKYLPDHLHGNILSAYWVAGGGNKDEKELLRIILKPWPGKRRVLLVNVESLSRPTAAITLVASFLNSGKTTFVIDESTRIKSPNSNRTKTILRLSEYAESRRILSGLVAPRSPLDVYSQFRFLDWKILGFRNYFSFRARYAIMRAMVIGGRSFNTVTGYQNLQELQDKISRRSYRVLKSECLDLPPKIYEERSTELSADQQRIYNELRKNAITSLESDSTITSTTAISLLQRLHQCIYGHIRDDLGNLHEIDSTPRINELLDVIEECDGKVIIWACFRPTISKLVEIVGREYGANSVVQFWGDTSDKDRLVAVDRFQNDPTCKFFIGNQSTGGIGITLTAANMVIYYANSFDLEHREQSEDRAHRIGLEHSVTYVDLIAKNTIEDKILDALKNKINLAATLTGERVHDWVR